MKLLRVFFSLALAGVLAACAAGPSKTDAHVHADVGAASSPSMCAMHNKMMGGTAPAEHHATMQGHMKSMAPEMRQRMHAAHGQCS